MYQNVEYFCKTKLFFFFAHSKELSLLVFCWFFPPGMKRRFIKSMTETRNVSGHQAIMLDLNLLS